MSQVSIIDIAGNNPQIPVQFDANIGFAVPLANVLEIFSDVSAAGTSPTHTEGVGNNITTYVQISQAIAATDATKIGLAAFDSSSFAVDANGFVTLTGGGSAFTSIMVDDSTAPGTNPVVPSAGVVTITGGQVGSGVVGTNVIQTNSTVANAFAIEIQRSAAVGAPDITKNGVVHFDAGSFVVDASGFVTLIGGSAAVDSIGTQTGTNPIVPTAAGLVTINGAVVAAGTNPVRTDGTGANTMAVEVQISQALAATDATKIGLSNFDSAAFTVDANGFVQLVSGGTPMVSITVDANTGPGTNPVVPTAGGALTISGAAVAAHSVPIETRSRAANAFNVEVQYAAAVAATDATKSGLAHFDSAKFSCDANGFVSTSGTGIASTITGDTGGALSPTAGNWNIVGGTVAAGTNPLKTAGSGSTLTVNAQISQAIASTDATKIGLSNFNSSQFSVDANGFVTAIAAPPLFPFTDVSGTSASMAINNAYTANNAGLVTLTLPSTAAYGSWVWVVGKGAGGWRIAQNAGQTIHYGNKVTTTGATGHLDSTLQYDSIMLICTITDTDWTCPGIAQGNIDAI